jgi:glycosyltransferase involved in cell wall biosynthesis
MTTRKPRILHCIPGLDGGGAERQLSYLAAELGRKGVDVHVAYHLRGPETSKTSGSGVTFHELPSHGNHDPMLLWQLIKTVRKIKPDVIQTWLLQMDVLGGLAALATRTPFLMTERVVAANYEGLWKNKLRFWIGRQAALVVANSQGGRKYWLSSKPPDLVKIVPNAVPVQEIEQALDVDPETCAAGESVEILLFAGRYSPQKNVSTHLNALFLVLAERTGAIALLFGAGPLQGELVERVRCRHLQNRVRIMGYTEQLWGWMKRATVFVSVSQYEGSPNVVCEAAAAGCPLVLSDIPQHRELMGDSAACFVPVDSPEEIAKGILDVLRHPAEARKRAQSAYKIVSGFTLDSLAENYLNLYALVTEGQLQRKG